MKIQVKFKLDKKTVLDFLVHNVEKIGLAIATGAFMLLVYSALANVERYRKTPKELDDAVRAGETKLVPTPDGETGLTVSDYVAQAKRSRNPIQEGPYVNNVVWDPPLFPPKVLRSEPALFTVQSLVGSADRGAFQMNATTESAISGTNIGDGTQGQRWVVLTGLVPAEKQRLAYLEAFRHSVSYNSRRDVPVYWVYWVERVEVSSPSEAASPNWEKAVSVQSQKAVEEAEKKWAQSGPVDPIAQQHLDATLVFPLGPLMGRKWGKSVAHEPEIPIVQNVGKKGQAAGRDAKSDGASRAGSGGGVAKPKDKGNDDSSNPFDSPQKQPAKSASPETKSVEKKASVPLLFRYFDFNVEPGKRYVYRVRLGLQNPNYRLQTALLKKAELAEKAWLATDWSETSPVISVPQDIRVLAVSVKPVRPGGAGDPSGRILLARWVQARGFEAFNEFTVARGQVAEFLNETFLPRSGVAHTTEKKAETKEAKKDAKVETPTERGGARGNTPRTPRTPRARTHEQPATAAPSGRQFKNVNYYSNMVVVDFRGGERLTGRRVGSLASGGEILILDSDGTLIVRNELDDKSAYDQLNATPVAAPAAGGRPAGVGSLDRR